MINKRGFLLGTVSTMVAPGVLSAHSVASNCGESVAGGLPSLHDGPGLAAWRGYRAQAFELTDGRRRWPVTLNSIDVQDFPGGSAQTEQFVLSFVNRSVARIPSGLQSLQHANGQSTLLYLTEVGDGAQPQSLRAEFNLFRGTA